MATERGAGWWFTIRLALVSVALFAAYSGVLSVLLPQQIAEIDPDGKVGSLALVTAVSFGVTALAQPLFGALSDRTRSRWGRRIPWMVACAVLGGALLGVMGGVQSVAALAVLWAATQFILNGVDIASTVYLVDRFPATRRGVIAGILGASAIVGGVAGSVVAGVAVDPMVGYLILAAALLAVVLVFAATVRDSPETGPAEPFALGRFLRGFVVDPRRHPDFARLVGWRVFFAIGYGAVHGYVLYILTDYIGVDPDAAGPLVGLVTAVGGAAVVVSVLLVGWLGDRFALHRRLLIGACVLVALADVVPLLLPTVGAILVLAGALGVGLGVAIASGTALASRALPDPDRHAARGLGIFNLASNVGQALAPIAASTVVALTGGYPALFVVSAILALVAGAFALPRRQRSWRPADGI